MTVLPKVLRNAVFTSSIGAKQTCPDRLWISHPQALLRATGLSLGLKSVHRTLFAPVIGLVPPFQVRAAYQKSPTANAVGLFCLYYPI